MHRQRTSVSSRAAALDEVVGLVRESAPAYPVVVVAGPRGSGRSTILRDAADALGLGTLWIDCSVFDHDRPLQSLREALGSSNPELFPGPMAAEIDRQLGEPEVAGQGEDLRAVARLIWSIIRPGLGRLASMQVIADDFDLLDPASQQVATYVLRRVAQLGTPVLLSVESATVSDRFPTVELVPLEVEEARILLEDTVGYPIPHRVAERVTGRCGGNVLALTAVVRELSEDQLTGRALLPHPLPMAGSIARRLGAGTPEARVLLAGLAVDETVDVQDAVRLSGSPDGLQRAVAAGQVEVRGPRVRAVGKAQALAAWWLMTASERAQMHRLLGQGDAACGPVHRSSVGEDVSTDELLRCAETLYDRGRQGHVGMVLDLLDGVLPASGFPLAQRLMGDGYVSVVRTLVDASAVAATGLSADQVHTLRTQVAVLTGLVGEPLPVAEIDRCPAVASRRWVRTVLGVVRSLLQRQDFAAAEELMDATASTMARAQPDCRALARFVRAEIGFHRREDWASSELSRAAQEWLASGEGHEAISTSIMVFYLLAVGNPQLAGAVLNRTQPSDGAGALTRVAHVVGRLQSALVQGHFGGADDLIAEMDRLLPYSAGGAHTLCLVVATAGARGPSRWRERIEWRLDHPDVAGQPPHARSEIAASSGLRSLVEGDHERAVALLDQALAYRQTLYSGATAVLANLLEANLAAGASPADNRALRKALGSWWPDRLGFRYAGLRARCDALCVDAAELDDAFAVAVASCPENHPVDLARTLLAYGRRLLLESRPVDAVRQLDRAQAIFANERLNGWREHVQRLQSVNNGSSNGQLSRTEREVVGLVLQRRTNAEIARTLFMSKRTVELHLTRVFRKVGVSRKSELIELDTVQTMISSSRAPDAPT